MGSRERDVENAALRRRLLYRGADGAFDSVWREIGGRRVHARVAGHADALQTIVLVHGIGVSGRYLLPVGARLARDARVLVPDLPGFGRSEKPRRPLTVRGCALALGAWLDAVAVERAAFLGNSMGCQTLVELAVSEPARVDSLVLVGPTVDAEARSFPRQALRLALDTLREPPGLALIVAFDYAVYGPLRFVATARSALSDPVETKAAQVAAPTLVVRGERDALVSQRWAEEIARRLPNGRLAVVPGVPHAVNYAAPDELARLTLGFLSERSAGASV